MRRCRAKMGCIVGEEPFTCAKEQGHGGPHVCYCGCGRMWDRGQTNSRSHRDTTTRRKRDGNDGYERLGKSEPRSKVTPLVVRLYRAAKALSDSCHDNYGSEAADNGIYGLYYDGDAKDKLDAVLRECEQNGGKSSLAGKEIA